VRVSAKGGVFIPLESLNQGEPSGGSLATNRAHPRRKNSCNYLSRHMDNEDGEAVLEVLRVAVALHLVLLNLIDESPGTARHTL
jgi:hypothetical protein